VGAGRIVNDAVAAVWYRAMPLNWCGSIGDVVQRSRTRALKSFVVTAFLTMVAQHIGQIRSVVNWLGLVDRPIRSILNPSERTPLSERTQVYTRDTV
jgi:hypothetical protein